MPTRKLMTMHAPMARDVANYIFGPTRELMDKFGFRTWVHCGINNPPDLTLCVEVPQVWMDRSATRKELEHFKVLYQAGRIDEAREFAQTGWPESLR